MKVLWGGYKQNFKYYQGLSWQEFFEARSKDPAKAYAFFQVIDKIERETPEETKKKLDEIGISYDEVNDFIEKGKPTAELESIIANLSARGMKDFVKVDYHVIRGLAYYTGVVFEAFDKKGEFRAIAGGGRYNNLVKLISGGKSDMYWIIKDMGNDIWCEEGWCSSK